MFLYRSLFQIIILVFSIIVPAAMKEFFIIEMFAFAKEILWHFKCLFLL